MSGPKVVHIVSREEIEATCKRWLLLVEEAAAEMVRVATRLGRMDAALQAQVNVRRSTVQGLLKRERWLDLQKQAPLAIAHFRLEVERLRGEAVAAAAAERSKRRRLLDAARSVATSLEAAGKPIPTALVGVIGQAMAASDADLASMQADVEAGISALTSPVAPMAPSSEQRELATRLRSGGAPRMLTDWLQANAKPDPKTERLDALLAELSASAPTPISQAFAERAASIAVEASLDRRSLLTDSLILEVGRHMSEERAVEAALLRCAEVRAELVAVQSEAAQACIARIEAAMAARHVGAMQASAGDAEKFLEAHRRDAAGAARRRAVLSGLASLGYEIREGMDAAWAKNGRIVVRRPGAEDYGVELAAPVDVSKLQTRLVGSDRPRTPRDAARDKDQETIWCGQFDKLRAIVAGEGSRIEIERALAPGEHAVKTVVMPMPVEVEAPSTGRNVSTTMRHRV
jgi:hypothetical protein